MSQRVHLNSNPKSHPHLFAKVEHNQVQSGDLYQGSRDPSKWYKNTEGQGCIDFWRTYYRPVEGASVTITPQPGRRMSHVNAPPGSRSAAPAGMTAAPPAEKEEDDADAVVIKSVERADNGKLRVVAELTITEDTFARFVADTIRDVLNESDSD